MLTSVLLHTKYARINNLFENVMISQLVILLKVFLIVEEKRDSNLD